MLTTITSYHSNIGRVHNPDPAAHWDPLVWVWCHPAVRRLRDKHTHADTLPWDLRDSVHAERGIRQGGFRLQQLQFIASIQPS